MFLPRSSFEHNRSGCQSMLTQLNIFLFVVLKLFSAFLQHLFRCSFDLLESGHCSFLLQCWISLEKFDLFVSVLNQTCPFSALPVLFECLHYLQSESLFVVCELSVQAHCVETNDPFFFSRDKRREIYHRPLSFFRFKWFICSSSSFLSLILFIFKLINFLL